MPTRHMVLDVGLAVVLSALQALKTMFLQRWVTGTCQDVTVGMLAHYLTQATCTDSIYWGSVSGQSGASWDFTCLFFFFSWTLDCFNFPSLPALTNGNI